MAYLGRVLQPNPHPVLRAEMVGGSSSPTRATAVKLPPWDKN